MKRFVFTGILAAGVMFSGAAFAADGAAVYKAKCAACHGPEGQGTAMAPGFKGSEFMKTASDADITDSITKGREGAAKKYKQFAIGMPPQKLSPEELKAVVEHIKGLSK